MKHETLVVLIKGICYVLIGALTPFAEALQQYAHDGIWPTKVTWVIVISGTIIGGCTQALSFLSGSYTDYKSKRDQQNQTAATAR